MTATLTVTVVDTRAFVDAVAWAAKAIPMRPTVPTLGGILLTADLGRLAFAGFDYELHAEAAIEVDETLCGRWLVSGRLLDGVAKTFDPKRPTTIETEDGRVVVRHGASRVGLPTMDVTEYPMLPEMPAAAGTVDAATFAAAIQRCAVAAGTNDAVPALTGVHLTFAEEHIRIQASDNIRAAVDSIPWSGRDAGWSVLVPADQIARLVGPLAAADDTVIVSLSETLVGFVAGRYAATARQLGGADRFPPIDKSYPTPDVTVVTAPAADLLKQIGLVEQVIEPKSPILLDIDSDAINLSAAGSVGDAASPVDAQVCGPAFTVHCNPTYLAAAIKACGNGDVVLSFADKAIRPFVVAAPDRHPNYRHIVVPIRTPKAS